MTAPYVSNPPAGLIIPVTLGCDFIFSLELEDDSANPLAFPGEVLCYVTNRNAPDVMIPATVADSLATIRIIPAVADTVSLQSTWRAVMVDPSYTPPAELPLLTGTFERHD